MSTVQEEVGLRGVPTAAYAIEPDVGIAIDGSLASDVPYAKEEDRHCMMGGGTGIYVMDSRTISDRTLVRFLVQLAEENGIPAPDEPGRRHRCLDHPAAQDGRAGMYDRRADAVYAFDRPTVQQSGHREHDCIVGCLYRERPYRRTGMRKERTCYS